MRIQGVLGGFLILVVSAPRSGSSFLSIRARQT